MITNTIRTYDEEQEFLRAMLNSLWYNRDASDYLKVLLELSKRLDGIWCEWSDDGNIIFGALVCRYGHYGVSPRAGWFDDQNLKPQLMSVIDEEIYETKEIIKEESITNV
jgi:hypothetical protein